jgi:hypothetical protein
MAFLASTGAFENTEPTQFQHFEMLWTILHWVVPAVLVGLLVRRHLTYVAGLVKLVASLILLACEYPSLIPVGARLPPPDLVLPITAELVSGIPLAIVLALVVAMVIEKKNLSTVLAAIILVPAGAGIAWAGSEYLSHHAALAKWAPERASLEAAADIQARSIKIYMHGSFAAYMVGIEAEQRPLVENLPTVDAGVGCVIKYMDVFDAQREYAIRYNKAIVTYLQKKPRPRPLS